MKKIEVGQVWRCRDGSLTQAISIGKSGEEDFPVSCCDGQSRSMYGRFLYLEENGADLVEYIATQQGFEFTESKGA